jgi:hypothetical protein
MEHHRYDVIYSPDDRGYYAEVFDSTGKTCKTTKLVKTHATAARHGWDAAMKLNYPDKVVRP